MKKYFLILAGLIFAVSLSSLSSAAQDPRRSARAEALKSLAINRSLLARFESEYAALGKEERLSSSDQMKRELADVQYKIKALDEEHQKLTRGLPETLQANEFLKDMLAKSEAEKRPVQNALGSELKPQFSIEETSLPTIPPPHKNRPMPLAATEKSSEETFKLHERALEFVAKKELRKAIKLYEEIVLLDPNDDEAFLIMGHCLVLLGDYEKAEETFQNAVHINPEDVNQIAPFYENLISQNPEDPDAYANLGFVYLMLGNLGRADQAFNQALTLNPQHPNALRGARILQSHPR